MRIKIIALSLLISISATACHHVAGNIIPESGPTMESIYDDLGDAPATNSNLPAFKDSATASINKSSLSTSGTSPALSTFSKLDNPELAVYILPHLSGSEMLPIPGYWTVFSAYPRDIYTLPLAVNQENR